MEPSTPSMHIKYSQLKYQHEKTTQVREESWYISRNKNTAIAGFLVLFVMIPSLRAMTKQILSYPSKIVRAISHIREDDDENDNEWGAPDSFAASFGWMESLYNVLCALQEKAMNLIRDLEIRRFWLSGKERVGIIQPPHQQTKIDFNDIAAEREKGEIIVSPPGNEPDARKEQDSNDKDTSVDDSEQILFDTNIEPAFVLDSDYPEGWMVYDHITGGLVRKGANNSDNKVDVMYCK